jgi:hypothetical protein
VDFVKAKKSPMPITFKSKPSDAKELRNRVRVLVGLELTQPFFVSRQLHQDPTISEPEELTFNSEFLIGKLDCSVLYDSKSNDTLFVMK